MTACQIAFPIIILLMYNHLNIIIMIAILIEQVNARRKKHQIIFLTELKSVHQKKSVEQPYL